MPFTIFTFVFTMATLPLGCALLILIVGVPLLVAFTNMQRAFRRALRHVAVCCIATQLGETEAGEAQEAGAEEREPLREPLCPPPAPAAAAGVVAVPPELDQEGADEDNNAAPEVVLSNDTDDWQPSQEEVSAAFSVQGAGEAAGKCDHGVGYDGAGGEAAAEADGHRASPFSRVLSRDRTSEEAAALERFLVAWGRTFSGRQCTLQDIVIAPPRAAGLGPRHFIRVADNVDEARRAQLVKAYKAAFSAMYVHIMDADEQRKHYGPDFSGFFE